MKRLSAALALCWLAAACTHEPGDATDAGADPPRDDGGTPGGDGGVPSGQPPGWADEIPLQRARDLNPDPRIVEIELTARVAEVELLPGRKTEMWTYDGSVPGPLIEANVGDTLIVHFRNELPESTTVHWHGVRLPAAMDGSDRVQDPVEPGGTFEYAFTVPDAGTYWYHPHVRSNEQVGRGLYGALVVHDPDEPPLGDELVVVVDDVSLYEDGTLRPQDAGGHFGDIFGREGRTLLVNGREMPTLTVRTGRPQRWRIVNSANARYYRLRLPGRMWRVGSDGGFIEAPEPIGDIVLVPGERMEVVWVPDGEPGTEVVVPWLTVDRGYLSHERPPEDMMRVRFADLPPETAPALPERLRTIEPIDIGDATPVEIRLTQKTVDGKVVMGINDRAHHEGGFMVHAHVGDTHVWEVVNTTDGSHPFHLHGYFFQVLGPDGEPEPVWRDTVDIPYQQTVKIAIHYEGRPGEWMFHCHILEHAELGMMGHLMVME